MSMQLQRNDLWSLEEYALQRPNFRRELIAYKKSRLVCLNEHARLMFEDKKTIRYQIQEMLRIEKIFEAAGIQDELDAYNPLIPDGNNWKATFMLAYDDEAQRRIELQKLWGIEHKMWVKVADHEKVFAIADEDMDRSNEDKTSSVHFLRFELNRSMIDDCIQGADICIGCDHDALAASPQVLDETIAQSLRQDLIQYHS